MEPSPPAPAARRGTRFEAHPAVAHALLVLGVLAVLVVVDLVLGGLLVSPLKGCWSAAYHHDLKPNFVGEDDWNGNRYQIVTNSLGFKDDAPRKVALVGDRRRILFLGDSFTEGVGLPFAQTYPALFWDGLGRDRVEVLDAAVMGYSPRLEWLKLQHLVEVVGLEVDELYLAIDVSDAQDELVWEHWQPGQEGPGALGWIRERSLLWHLALVHWRPANASRDALWSDGSQSREIDRWPDDPALQRRWALRGLELAAGNVRRIAALCRARGIRLTILVYPWQWQLSRGDRDSLQVRFWRDVAAAEGATFVDLFQAFFEVARPGGGLYLSGDQHWSARGHRLVADTLLAHRAARSTP